MSEQADLGLHGNLALARAVIALTAPSAEKPGGIISDAASLALLNWFALRVSVERKYSCYVLQETLVRQTGLGLRTVQRRMVELRDAGLLATQKRRGQSDIFRLNAEMIFAHRDAAKAFKAAQAAEENEDNYED